MKKSPSAYLVIEYKYQPLRTKPFTATSKVMAIKYADLEALNFTTELFQHEGQMLHTFSEWTATDVRKSTAVYSVSESTELGLYLEAQMREAALNAGLTNTNLYSGPINKKYTAAKEVSPRHSIKYMPKRKVEDNNQLYDNRADVVDRTRKIGMPVRRLKPFKDYYG